MTPTHPLCAARAVLSRATASSASVHIREVFMEKVVLPMVTLALRPQRIMVLETASKVRRLYVALRCQ